jgi:arylsulfatase A-like enzyme
MSSPAAQPPDVLVVVMDAVRGSDFPLGPYAVGGMPFVRSLAARSIVFPRAASVAPWTIPSHASLLTGLYPWEHGSNVRNQLRFPPAAGMLPTGLRSLGYRSLSLSANFLLGSEFDWVQSFDEACWGGWWEPYFRAVATTSPVFCSPTSISGSSGGIPPRPPRQLRGLVRQGMPWAHRFPWILAGVNRFRGRLQGDSDHGGLAVSPWIEPTLGRWLAAQPRSRPLFVFVNLLDAHEPYFPDPALNPTWQRWWRQARTRQDRLNFLSGSWQPRSEEYARLRQGYREMIRLLDHRLAGIVGAFEAAGRWDNTLFVLTSDHGQAFGDQGLLFHMLRVDEAEIRIPLWVRRPRDADGGTRAVGWGSLIDVVPTVLREIGAPGPVVPTPPSGLPLQQLLDAPRPTPVFAAADGIGWAPMLENLSPERRAAIDRIWVAAYDGPEKVVLDVAQNELHGYRIDRDPDEQFDLWATEGARLSGLAESTRTIARQLSGEVPATVPAGVEARLRSWGYL